MTLQNKQKQLDDYIIESKNLHFMDMKHLISNMFCAGFSELYEIKNDIENPSEWIDLLHFVLSIANKYDIVIDEKVIKDPSVGYSLEEYLDMCYDDFTLAMDYSANYKHWSGKRANYESLAVQLNWVVRWIAGAVTWLGYDVFEEYEAKYQVNIQRQKEGY